MSEDELGWLGRVRKNRAKRGRRMKALLAVGAVLFALAAAAGIIFYLTNPSYDDFTEWHSDRAEERYRVTHTWQNYYPSTAGERRKYYDMYIERKSYIFFSLYVSKTHFESLDRAVFPFLCSPPTRRGTVGRPSEYLPKGWKPRIMFTGFLGKIREREEEEE
jgi:hypothetical protein